MNILPFREILVQKRYHVDITLLTGYNFQYINNFLFSRWCPGEEDTYETTDQ